MSFTRSPWSVLDLPRKTDRFVFATGNEFASLDPATGTPVAPLRTSTPSDCTDAIASSCGAARAGIWASRPAVRSDTLYEWSRSLLAHQFELAELLTREQGKSLQEARIEVAETANQFRYYAGLARVYAGRAISPGPGIECVSLQEPMGVVGIITPWNWPLILLAKSLAPALAAGNACVIKPAEDTPAIVIQALSLMLSAADVPMGVVSCLLGDGPTVGSALVGNPRVDMVAFTGSAATGREVAAAAGRALQPITLELGGKSPSVVFADADQHKVVAGILAASITTSGQMCTAGSRVLVEESISDRLGASLTQALSGMQVGDGLDERTAIGPLISDRQRQRVIAYVDQGKKEGSVLFEGAIPASLDRADGFFVAPIIFDDLPRESILHREEIFGPVITIQACAGEDEMIEEANATPYGLAAGLWTSDVRRAWRVARALDVGTVWVNTHNQFYPEIETGAWKQSGFGDSQGIAGLARSTLTGALKCGELKTR